MAPLTQECRPEEIAEIDRHKYFLSEAAGYDVGWEFAEKDWQEKYAADFRNAHAPAEAAPAAERAAPSEASLTREQPVVREPFLKRILSIVASKNH